MTTYIASLALLLLELFEIIFALAVVAYILAFDISLTFFPVPFVPTKTKYFPRIIAELDIKPHDMVYELGSGDGRFLLACARRHPDAQYVGVEGNIVLHALACTRRLLAGGAPNVTFLHVNFFTVDVRKANRVYAYLSNAVMDALLPKFIKEFKNVRLASSAFQFKDKRPELVVELSGQPGSHGEHLLYLYEF